jgi:hypothetical protein
MTEASDRRHGTTNGYTNLRCRCVPCTEANRAATADRRHRRSEREKAEREAGALRAAAVGISRSTGLTFGVDWTCVSHGDGCPKAGLDWDCTATADHG